MRLRFDPRPLGFLLMIAGGLIVSLAALASVDSRRSLPAPIAGEVIAAGPDAAPQVQADPTQPSPPAPTVEPSRAPIQRLIAPRIGIDANVIVMGVKPDGEMQSPNTPTDVAWYHFTGYPGFGSNAVFAGHVDFANYGKGIFWHLRDLKQGDDVQVRLADGTHYAYRVVSVQTFSSLDAPVAEIIGPTERESVTLITCEGAFNTRTRRYDRRLIVRAERVFA